MKKIIRCPLPGQLGYLPGEQIAVNMVLAQAEIYGYGNLISHLQAAWDEKLKQSVAAHKAAKKPCLG